MTFSDNHFGLICCCQTLEHVCPVHEVVGEIIRVVRDGALIAIKELVRFEKMSAGLIDFQILQFVCCIRKSFRQSLVQHLCHKT